MQIQAALAGLVIIVLATAALYVAYGQNRNQSVLTETATTTQGVSGEGEEAGAYTAVDPAMTASWRSKEDAKFTREFKPDGTVVDRYQGDASATAEGVYVTIDPFVVTVPNVPAENLSGMTVLRITWEGDPAPMYFSINKMTESELHMTNLSGRGNLLMFTKIK